MEPELQVCLAGGGNLCHASVAAIGAFNPKWKINVLTTRPELYAEQIVGNTEKSSWESKGKLMGRINRCSKNPNDVIPGSHIVIVCCPAQYKYSLLKSCDPFIMEGALVGSIFGQGGFD